MSTVSVSTRPLQPLRRRAHPSRRQAGSLIALTVLCAFASGVFLIFFADGDQRVVFTPMLACLNLALLFVSVLYRRDGELPVFEGGTLFVAATTLYSVFPLLNFAAGGMAWRPPSDYRLVGYDPTPAEIGSFAWNYVLFLGTFVAVYLIVRGRKSVPRVFARVPQAVQTSVIVTFVVMMILVQLVSFIVLPPEAQVSVYEGGNFAYRANVPLVFLQFLNIGGSALLALKLLFAILVLARWRERKWRLILFVWLVFEFFLIVRSQARGGFVLLILMIGITYHRLVKPLSLRKAVIAGSGLILGFLAFGVFRDTRGAAFDPRSALTVNNEFQTLFSNAYDVHMRKQYRTLPAPPPQMKYAELYMIIPSQLLPFAKIDPAEWYADVLQISHTGSRVMFGVITKAMLGLGKTELFLRGALAALLLALLHRWYVRRADRFWPTALYAYIVVWTFYTFRSNTFTVVYLVLYYFGSAALLVAIVRFGLGGRQEHAGEPGR
jgi:hypothetical protein